MNEISLPIFIAEDLDISSFSDVKIAEKYLEAIDVRDNVYIGYDAEGRLLNLSTRQDSVIITLAEENPSHYKELEDMLRVALIRCKVDVLKIELGNLKEIVSLAKILKYR